MPLIKKLKTKNEVEEKEVEEENEESSDEMSEDDDEKDEDEEEESGDENENEESGDENEEIMIDFEARELLESDFESVKLLLEQKLSTFPLNLSEMARIITQQEKIGNVIFQAINEEEEEEEADEDSTIFGVLSLIDLNSERVKTFSTSFKQFLFKECQKSDKAQKSNKFQKLNELFSEKKITYVVNERFVNIPQGISAPMFDSLLKDLKNEGTENFAAADYWLFISKAFDEAKKKAGSSSSAQNDKLYSNAEEEAFAELSDFKFEIAMSNKAGSKGSDDEPQLNPSLTAFLVPFEKVADAVEKFKPLVK